MDRLTLPTRDDVPPFHDTTRMQTRRELKLQGIRIKKKEPRCGNGRILQKQKLAGGEDLFCCFCSDDLQEGYYNCDCEEHETRLVCGDCISARVKQEQKEQSGRMKVLARKSAAWLSDDARAKQEARDRLRKTRCCAGKLISKKKVESGGKIKCYLCNTGVVEEVMDAGAVYFECECAKHQKRKVCAEHLPKRIRQEKDEQRATMNRMTRLPSHLRK